MNDSSNFSIKTDHHTFTNDKTSTLQTIISISMTRNGKTFHVSHPLECFQDGKILMDILHPTFQRLVKNLYPECFSREAILAKKIHETELQLVGLREALWRVENDKSANNPEGDCS